MKTKPEIIEAFNEGLRPAQRSLISPFVDDVTERLVEHYQTLLDPLDADYKRWRPPALQQVLTSRLNEEERSFITELRESLTRYQFDRLDQRVHTYCFNLAQLVIDERHAFGRHDQGDEIRRFLSAFARFKYGPEEKDAVAALLGKFELIEFVDFDGVETSAPRKIMRVDLPQVLCPAQDYLQAAHLDRFPSAEDIAGLKGEAEDRPSRSMAIGAEGSSGPSISTRPSGAQDPAFDPASGDELFAGEKP